MGPPPSARRGCGDPGATSLPSASPPLPAPPPLTPALGGAPQELSGGRVVDEELPLGQALVEGLLLILRHGGGADGEGSGGRGGGGGGEERGGGGGGGASRF
jgi:hypothetical protein